MQRQAMLTLMVIKIFFFVLLAMTRHPSGLMVRYVGLMV